MLLEYNSVNKYTGEERWDAIGAFEAGIMFVVYVERITMDDMDDNDIIRIISARYADKREKKRYVKSN